MKSITRALINKKRILFLFLFLILLFITLEFSAKIYDYFRHGRYIYGGLNKEEQSLLNRYKKEFLAVKYNFHPYLLYRLRPSQKFITCGINSLGFRGKEISRDKKSNFYRIAILGGSVVWGTNSVSNDLTIPALLERLLNQRAVNKNFEVINAGTGGYISNQERILFEEEIIDLDVDMIIVLDGINDIYAPMQGAKNNFPGEFSLWEERMNNPFISYARKFIIFLSKKSVFINKIYSKSEIILRNIFLRERLKNIDESKIIGEYSKYVTRNYFKDIYIMSAVAEKYRIKSYFFLQPTITYAKPLSANEKKLLSDIKRNIMLANYEGYIANVYNSIIVKGKEFLEEGVNFYNLSDIFSNVKDDIYIDYCHFAGKGNKIVSDNIFAVIRGPLEKEGLIR